MADVKWIKIVTDIFDDDKILLIESMPDADAIIVIWFKLLCLAGKQNNSGVFQLHGRIPYTDEMFSTVFRRPLNTVRMALQVFEQFGMIEIINNTITIPNWGKHQKFDKIEAKNEYMRNYMREYRSRQKALSDGKEKKAKTNRKTNGEYNSKSKVSEADKNRIEKNSSRYIYTNADINNFAAAAENPFGEQDDSRPNFDTVEVYASTQLGLTPGNMEEFARYKQDLPDELIRHAIDEAGASNVKTWKYVKGILNRYIADGINTLEQALAQEHEHEELRARTVPQQTQPKESALFGKFY